MGALALTRAARASSDPYDRVPAGQLHIPPSTWRFDPTGRRALEELDRLIAEAGPETIGAFFCEPVSAAALPGYSPPDLFWQGLAERRERHGFLVCFDEVVTGMGADGKLVCRAAAPDRARHHHRRQGARRGLRAAGGDVLPREDVYDALAAGVAQLRARPHVGRRPAALCRRPGCARRHDASAG